MTLATVHQEQIMDILTLGPDHLRSAMKELASLKRSEANMQRDQKRLKTRLAAEIAAEKDENGKPKYSNEIAREAEMNERIKTWGEMRVIEEYIDKYALEVSNASIEVEYLQERLRSARAAALLLSGGLGI